MLRQAKKKLNETSWTFIATEEIKSLILKSHFYGKFHILCYVRHQFDNVSIFAKVN